ncbi:baseplate J/gp47 family protein [Caproicibacterium sp. XB1]|uniref:baseplate J/gp47 family protein n=1 Tax=Caproicibacterium sp. XB1 TaxID=3396405 RepID=UPI0039B6F9EA
MYENMTYETILQRMLMTVPDSMDKREGSIIYDALAPAAMELQQAYLQLDNILNEGFADTATREYLIRRAAERGLSPRQASMAVLEAELKGADVPNGTRFSIDALNYVVIDKIDATHYKVQCETPGTEGNRYFGTLTPVDYVSGLQSADLTELLVPGEDDEDTETFRQRYLDSLNEEAFGGNVADYKQKVGAIAGVGGVKVYPVWNGPGTVKVIFTDSQNGAPTEELVQEVQTTMDPEQNHGTGLGLAPIGHMVTVQGAQAYPVAVSANITCMQGHTWDDIAPGVETAVEEYLASLAAKWADGNLVVRISQMESHILDVDGVLDVESLTLNGAAANLPVPDDKIPTRGEVTNSANSTT